jgi:uncharacterized pyridoxal phosphate-containing UPF0001 family protein
MSEETNFIGENLKKVDQTIKSICNDMKLLKPIKILPISKTKSPGYIMAAYNHGIRDFGENYVQELISKAGQVFVNFFFMYYDSCLLIFVGI